MAVVDADQESGPSKSGALQFIQFCVVGLTSTIIDFAVLRILTHSAGLIWQVAKLISFALSVTNGFVWNSVWTFRGMGSSKRHAQYVKFVAVNIIGLILAMIIIKTSLLLLPGGKPMEPRNLMIGNLIAVGVGSVWNFLGNRKWTYA